MVKRLWKKGQEDTTFPYTYLLKILLPLVVAAIVIFIIWRIANASLPK